VVIIETSIFTRQVRELLSDGEYRDLQEALVSRPDAGSVVRGSGGLRKLRWGVRGKGKRGGVRIIYYWAARRAQILMLLIYSKSERDDLTPGQLKSLKRVVEEEYR
jgi:mRNA-degrading endonuclease RelE of RelBE toxin-antitoxin system